MAQIKDEYEDNTTFTEQIDKILNQKNDQNYCNNYNVSPWDVESLYEFQYFNCPTCPYKHHSAHDFVDHAFNSHPESKNYPDSFSDILPPWKYESENSFINSMKNELNEYEESIKSVENSNLIDDDEVINVAKSEEYSDNWNTSSDVTNNLANVTNNVTNVTSEMTNGPNIVTNQEKVTSLGVGSKHSNAPNQNVHEEKKSFNKKEDIDTTLQFQNVHKGLKELSCKHCDKKYYAELALISHLKSAHNVFQDLQHVKKVHEGSKDIGSNDHQIQSKSCGIIKSENKLTIGKGILYNNQSDKLEFLDEITPNGRDSVSEVEENFDNINSTDSSSIDNSLFDVNKQCIVKSEEYFDNLNASSEDNNFPSKILPDSGPKVELYTYQKSGKHIETLKELTTTGKWLLFCLIHLLFQGKNSKTKKKTMPTNKWLQNNENIEAAESTVRKVLKNEFKVNLKPLALLSEYFTSQSGAIESLTQLTPLGKEFFYSCVHLLLMDKRWNEEAKKNTLNTFLWLENRKNFVNGEEFVHSRPEVLEYLRPYTYYSNKSFVKPIIHKIKFNDCTEVEVRRAKNQCGKHTFSFLANVLGVSDRKLKSMLGNFKFDDSNPEFTFKDTCEFCLWTKAPLTIPITDSILTLARTQCVRHKCTEIARALKVNHKLLKKKLGDFEPTKTDMCDFCNSLLETKQQCIVKSEEYFDNLNASPEDSSFWSKILPDGGPNVELYIYQKSGKQIETLTELTRSGKWFLYCLIHLLLQGKNSDTKEKIFQTYIWLRDNPNIEVLETSVRRDLKKEFKDNLKPLAYLTEYFTSESGAIESLTQLTTLGKYFFYSCVHLLLHGSDEADKKRINDTILWLENKQNYLKGEEIIHSRSEILEYLGPYKYTNSNTSYIKPTIHHIKNKNCTEEEVRRAKNQCGKHTINFLATILGVHHQRLKAMLEAFKFDEPNQNFISIDGTCEFCLWNHYTPIYTPITPENIAYAKTHCVRHKPREIAKALKFNPKTFSKYYGEFKSTKKDICDFCDQNIPTSETPANPSIQKTPCTCGTCMECDSEKQRISCDTVMEYNSEVMKNHAEKDNSNKSRQQSHILVKCEICDKEFKSRNGLKHHANTVHGGENNVLCSDCGKSFQTKKSVRTHFLRVHEGRKPHTCNACGKSFYKPSILKIHYRTVHEGIKEKKDILCTLCAKPFLYPHHLKIHLRTFHKDRKCGICSELFNNYSEFKKHLKQHEEEIYCKICNKSFTTTQAMKKHIYAIHEGHNNDYQCDTCGKSFSGITYLRLHIRTIHEGRKDYKCKTCGKLFGKRETMKNHIRQVHEGERNHSCETCGKSFFNPGDLRRHYDSVHLKIPDVWNRKKKSS